MFLVSTVHVGIYTCVLPTGATCLFIDGCYMKLHLIFEKTSGVKLSSCCLLPDFTPGVTNLRATLWLLSHIKGALFCNVLLLTQTILMG